MLALLLATLVALPRGPSPHVRLAHNSLAEQQTRAQLLRLLNQFDLSRWAFTDSLVIDEGQIPHSHPVLTLHTRHRRDDELLLSTYLHEQLHWFVAGHRAEADSALAELRPLFGELPVGFPQGSDSKEGNDGHILVIVLEYQALRELVGELRALAVMQFWATDHYTAIYRGVLANWRPAERILRKYRLTIL